MSEEMRETGKGEWKRGRKAERKERKAEGQKCSETKMQGKGK